MCQMDILLPALDNPWIFTSRPLEFPCFYPRGQISGGRPTDVVLLHNNLGRKRQTSVAET